MNVQHLVINAKRSSLSLSTVDKTVFVHENSAIVCENRTYLKCGAGRIGGADYGTQTKQGKGFNIVFIRTPV
jgi:hypothetical protein